MAWPLRPSRGAFHSSHSSIPRHLSSPARWPTSLSALRASPANPYRSRLALGGLLALLFIIYIIATRWWAQAAALAAIETAQAAASFRLMGCSLEQCCFRPSEPHYNFLQPISSVRGSLSRQSGSQTSSASSSRSASASKALVAAERRRQRLDALLAAERSGSAEEFGNGLNDESNVQHLEDLEGNSRGDKFYSIVINTFKGRDENVARLVTYYSSCEYVDKVVVSWNDVGRPVPRFLKDAVDATNGVAIVDEEVTSNLSNRFLPRKSVRTNAIFTSDDDMQYNCELMTAGFKLWQKDPATLVSFAPRHMELHPPPFWALSRGCYYQYFSEKAYATGTYNTAFVTKGGFLDKAFFTLFHADEEFAHVRAEVDNKITGEDMLMSFLHTLYAGQGKVIAVESDCSKLKWFEEANSLGGSTSGNRPYITHLIFETLQQIDVPSAVFDLAGPSSRWGTEEALGETRERPSGVSCIPG